MASSSPSSPDAVSEISATVQHESQGDNNASRRRREHQEPDGMRRNVESDYRIPRWLKKQGLSCPYSYNRIFVSKHGLINYEISGPDGGPLVVTFHGLNGTHMTFQDVQDVLTKYGFRVLTFDLYGHGLSASPRFHLLSKTYSIDFFIKQTNELLEHLGLQDEPLNLIGFSMGCCIASGYAKLYPEKILRIILISPAGMLQRKPVPVKCLSLCPWCVYCIPCFVCRCCFNKQLFLQKFSDEERRTGMAEALWNRLMWQLFVKKGVIGAFLGCVMRLPLWNSRTLYQQTGSAGKPMLVLWGRQDVVCPPSVAKEMLDCFPNGHLIVFQDATHLLLADQPQAAIATIMTFLELPPDCQLSEWKYVLPFNSKGQYVPRGFRSPPSMTQQAYLQQLGYRPRYHVRLPQREGARATDQPRQREKGGVGVFALEGPHSQGPYLFPRTPHQPPQPATQQQQQDEGVESAEVVHRTMVLLPEGRRITAEVRQQQQQLVNLSSSAVGGTVAAIPPPLTPRAAVTTVNYPQIRVGGEAELEEPLLHLTRNLVSNSSVDSAGVVVAPDFLFHSQHPMAALHNASSGFTKKVDESAVLSTAASIGIAAPAALPAVEASGGVSGGNCFSHHAQHMATAPPSRGGSAIFTSRSDGTGSCVGCELLAEAMRTTETVASKAHSERSRHDVSEFANGSESDLRAEVDSANLDESENDYGEFFKSLRCRLHEYRRRASEKLQDEEPELHFDDMFRKMESHVSLTKDDELTPQLLVVQHEPTHGAPYVDRWHYTSRERGGDSKFRDGCTSPSCRKLKPSGSQGSIGGMYRVDRTSGDCCQVTSCDPPVARKCSRRARRRSNLRLHARMFVWNGKRRKRRPPLALSLRVNNSSTTCSKVVSTSTSTISTTTPIAAAESRSISTAAVIRRRMHRCAPDFLGRRKRRKELLVAGLLQPMQCREWLCCHDENVSIHSECPSRLASPNTYSHRTNHSTSSEGGNGSRDKCNNDCAGTYMRGTWPERVAGGHFRRGCPDEAGRNDVATVTGSYAASVAAQRNVSHTNGYSGERTAYEMSNQNNINTRTRTVTIPNVSGVYSTTSTTPASLTTTNPNSATRTLPIRYLPAIEIQLVEQERQVDVV